MNAAFDVLRHMPLPHGESRQFCPACAQNRKRHHQHTKTLQVNNRGDHVLFRCWHCDEQGRVQRAGAPARAPKAPPPKPVKPDEIIELTPSVIRYFSDRGISEATLVRAGMMASRIGSWEAAAYPYGGMVGYKIKSLRRDTDGKRRVRIIGRVESLFLQELTNPEGHFGAREDTDLDSNLSDIANLDTLRSKPFRGFELDTNLEDSNLEDSKLDTSNRLVALARAPTRAYARGPSIIICEGEDDALSCLEAGLENPTSVPHGSINPYGTSSPHNSKLAFIADQPDFWASWRRVIIATDADKPGLAMREEIARRLGRSRCSYVSYPEGYKDVNEVLAGLGEDVATPLGRPPLPALGRDILADVISAAEPCSIPGLYQASSVSAELRKLRAGVEKPGDSTGYRDLDKLFRIAPGLTVVTGWPKHGKSDFVDQVCINLAETKGDSTVIWSPENTVPIHVAKLIEKRARARFWPGMPNPMSDMALEQAESFVQRHFNFVRMEGSAQTIEAVLERFSAAVERYGCRQAVIDPYNAIHNTGEREDQFIVNMLNKIRDFSQTYDVHVWIVAHPKGATPSGGKPRICDGNDISGGVTWWAKCDFGLTVYRDEDATRVKVWAVRNAHLGQNGTVDLMYNTNTASFEDRDTFLLGPEPRTKRRSDDFDDFEPACETDAWVNNF